MSDHEFDSLTERLQQQAERWLEPPSPLPLNLLRAASARRKLRRVAAKSLLTSAVILVAAWIFWPANHPQDGLITLVSSPPDLTTGGGTIFSASNDLKSTLRSEPLTVLIPCLGPAGELVFHPGLLIEDEKDDDLDAVEINPGIRRAALELLGDDADVEQEII